MASKKDRKEQLKQGANRLQANVTRITGVYILLLFIIHPMMIGPAKYENITKTKLETYYIFFFGLAAVLAVYFILELANGYKPKRLDKSLFTSIRWYEYALIGYFIMLIISLLFSVDVNTSLLGSSDRNEGFVTQLTYIGAILILGRLYRAKERDLLVFCAIAALVCLYGISQYYNNDFLGLFPLGYDRTHGPRMFIFSTMSNQNVFSTYSGIALCFCVILFTQMTSKMQWAYLPIGMVLFYMLILGRTDSGYMGLLAAFGLSFAFLVRDRKCLARLLLMLAGCVLTLWLNIKVHWPEWEPHDLAGLEKVLLPAALVLGVLSALIWFVPAKLPVIPARTWRIVWAVVCVVVVVSAIIAVPVIAERTGNEQLMDAAQVLRGNLDDSFATNRGFMWKRSFGMIEFPRALVGFGPDMFGPLFKEKFGMEAFETNGEVPDKAHNEYLQWLFDEGILALLLILAGFGLILWSVRKKLDNPVTLALAVAMVFFMVQAFFNISTPFAHPLVWTCWGMLASCAYHNPVPLPVLGRRVD